MIKRCIMIFPEFENGEIIDRIRKEYDRLADHVRPHITLVFPFDSDIESETIRRHIETTTYNVKPFEIMLQGITPVDNFGKYLFLNVKRGEEEIVGLHKKLYTGILEEFLPVWLRNGTYRPHVTVGIFNSIEELKVGAQETEKTDDTFVTVVKTISVEIIDENEDSIIEMHISFNNNET